MPQTGGLTTRGGLNETTRNHLDRQRAEVDTFADLADLTERVPNGHVTYVKDEQLHYKLLNDLVTWKPAFGEEGLPTTTGGGYSFAEFAFTYSADSPTSQLPAHTVGIISLYNGAGLNILRANRRLDLQATPPTITILGQAIEGDTSEGVLLLSSNSTTPPGGDTDTGTYTEPDYVAAGYVQ